MYECLINAMLIHQGVQSMSTMSGSDNFEIVHRTRRYEQLLPCQ